MSKRASALAILSVLLAMLLASLAVYVISDGVDSDLNWLESVHD